MGFETVQQYCAALPDLSILLEHSERIALNLLCNFHDDFRDVKTAILWTLRLRNT